MQKNKPLSQPLSPTRKRPFCNPTGKVWDFQKGFQLGCFLKIFRNLSVQLLLVKALVQSCSVKIHKLHRKTTVPESP